MTEKKKICVLCGGRSGEHEISLISAGSVINALDREKFDVIKVFISKQGEWSIDGEPFDPWQLPKICDFVLPILHGPNGEDGTVQGLLELLNIPYGGTGVLGAAVTMDKIVAKKVFAAAGLEQAPYVTLSSADLSDGARRQDKIREIKESLKLPWFVKPANMGSSVGITKVCREEDLEAALEEAAGYDSRLVVEQGIDARELETGVMGNDELEVAEVGEIMPAADFYSYDDKYINGASKLAIPADISKEQREAIREMAARAYRAAGCFGFSRCDFLMDRDTGRIYINEINSIPGFTDISMFPKLFLYCGYTYPGLIERIIELGYEKYNAKNNR